MSRWIFVASIFLLTIQPALALHLFILSGQSNMEGLDENFTFKPALRLEFGETNVRFANKRAVNGAPIRRWYKAWVPPDGGTTPEPTVDIYDSLMDNVYRRVNQETFETVTFIWMQGESDAIEEYSAVYQTSLMGLYDQLSSDLERNDIYFVIGRLSDHLMGDSHWVTVRNVQVAVGESNPRFGWVNTDDLNGAADDLHYTSEGYRILGQRFADKAIELIRRSGDHQALAPPTGLRIVE